MADRLDLHKALKSIVPNVYYQPPESVKLIYPCIVYSRKQINVTQADNTVYKVDIPYKVTLIDKNPDSEYLLTILKSFNHVVHVTHYTSNNLNHDEYVIYY